MEPLEPSMKKRIAPAVAAVTAFSHVGALWAQADAGALQQQIERERQRQLPQRVAPEKPAQPPAMRPVAGVTVVVKQFRFAGNTLISSERLAKVVAPYLDRPLDFAQLQAAAAAVGEAYREAGWVVGAYLPQQDIKEGIVTIQIVEALFGKLETEGESTRVAAATVLARFNAQQKPGEPINTERLDRALLLTDDLPGVTVSGSLKEGANEGETDLVVKLADEPLLLGDIGVDNTGSRSTGEDRLTANLAVNSPLGVGDQLSANLIHSRGSDYLRLGYTLPVGTDGWRVGINAARLDYRLIAPEFAALRGEGHSNTLGLEAQYPLIRSRLANLYLSLAYDKKDFDNRTATGTTSRYDNDVVTLGLHGNLFDNWGGGGANAASLIWSQGNIDQGTPDPGENRTVAGRYQKLRWNLSRQQVLTPDWSLYAAYGGQWGSKNLDNSEKFYLGGASGVRAYPANEAGGSDGQMLNLELRWRLPEGFTLTGFYDWGRITQFKEAFTGMDTPNTYSLKGYGLSLAWLGPKGIQLKATWARRDGENPNADPTTGRDQDGSLDRNRWWFFASVPF
ncbi:MAG: ShlB/FhaC/HecB family hemolysin secretion/activation protein [Rhodocyclaceae bacterium]|nr:ShlB/FhaC/HecB family hemolysin secretion/activation protein [Rhodocyclaceae bacterium]